jgi:predicted permease
VEPRDDDEVEAYGRFRRIGAGALIATAIAYILLGPPFAYHPDPIILGLLLGAAAVLLGVEGGLKLLR